MIQQTDSHSQPATKSVKNKTLKQSLSSGTCPKCEDKSTLVWRGDYKQCFRCGYEDYEHPFVRKKYKAKGLHYVAHYNGTHNYFKDKVVKVEVVSSHGPWSIKAGVIFKVTCTWCGFRMEPTSKYMLYQCKAGHRVRIQNKEDGSLYWD